jgi:hypothetical protein
LCPITFKKGDKQIWVCKEYTVCADLLKEGYMNHRQYPTLKEALEKESDCIILPPNFVEQCEKFLH